MLCNLDIAPLIASIHSYRGGTGKTTLTTQIAYYTSQIKEQKTILIDLDVFSLGVQTALGLKDAPKYINSLIPFKKSMY